jgi:hypothetical protein
MKLSREFFNNPLSTGLARRFILSKLTGDKIDDDNRKDYHLLESWVDKTFSSAPSDNIIRYNGYDFYCIGTREQLESQITTYFQLHREDTIDQILKDQ